MKLSKDEVLKVLPHRDPMLFVDEVVDVNPMKRVVTKLFIDEKWAMFDGHFPGDPVFPGVLSVEAMAQAVDIMIMTMDKYKGLTPLFMGINDVKFRRRVDPGQTVFCHGEMVKVDEERQIMTARCKMILNKTEETATEETAAEAEIVIAMR